MGAEDRSSHFILGDDLDVEGDRDFDASVRALRPRSSRRGSWESEASSWSDVLEMAKQLPVGQAVGHPLRSKKKRAFGH